MIQRPATIESQQEKASNFPLSAEELKLFNDQGFLGPYNLYDPEEAKEIFMQCFKYPRLLLPWKKGRHAVVKKLASIAKSPPIVERIASILGENVLLWGSILIRQQALGRHPMHVDVEHATWNGASIWIAMQNVVSRSSFSVISGSHKLNTSPQELQHTVRLNCSNDEAVLDAAQKIDPKCKLVNLEVQDGQFIIFSGKLWHGTKNNTQQMRKSIVLQYTTPDNKVMIPKTYTMPKNYWYEKSPLCLLVKGKDNFNYNEYVEFEHINGRSNILKALFMYLPHNLIENIKTRM